MELLAAFVLWLGLAFVAGMIAGSKGRSSIVYFLVALMLPLIGVVLALGMSDRRSEIANRKAARQADRRPKRTCPNCAETVLAEAKKCRHCGADLAPVKVSRLKSLVWGPLPRR